MGTKKLWSINNGRVWHRKGHKIYLPIDQTKSYTIIFSEFLNEVPPSITDVVISNEEQLNFVVNYSDYSSSSASEITFNNINVAGLNEGNTTINASVLINGLQDNINI